MLHLFYGCFADLPKISHSVSQRSLCGDVGRLTRVMIELGAEEEAETKRVKRASESPLMNQLGGNQRPQCRLQGSYDEAGVDVVFFSHGTVGLELDTGVVVCKHRQGTSSDSVSGRSSICLHCGL